MKFRRSRVLDILCTSDTNCHESSTRARCALSLAMRSRMALAFGAFCLLIGMLLGVVATLAVLVFMVAVSV